jgi:predicted phosphate transport protein (TIGR00153 family)
MSFLPKLESFFDQFEKQGRKTVEGCRALLAWVSAPDDSLDPRVHAENIARIERECDEITHSVVAQLRHTLITPLDRNDIHRLITKMDDVMDFVEATAERLALYEIRQMSPEVRALARVLLSSSEQLLEAVTGFRNLKRPQLILDNCVEIGRLEQEADNQLRCALARLFRDERDPIAIMKWKEIYEMLETATDRCEDVANIIEGVVLENS